MAASKEPAKLILIGFIAIFCCSIITDGEKIGVNYGMDGDNLPTEPEQVATLMKNKNIGKMRIFAANNKVLNAFANSGIDVIVGVENPRLQEIAGSQDAANAWVNDNIRPFPNVKYIAVGNEVLAADSGKTPYLVPAMTNIQTAIQNANLQGNIKVSTAQTGAVIKDYRPGDLPSQGAFKDDVKDTMSQILKFLSDNGAPMMANVYPYFTYAYINNRNSIPLEYALFKPTPSVADHGRSYSNLFDAMVDTFISAMEASGYSNVPIVITETGWPSAGGDVATVENAQAYNNNLIQHILSGAGTPKRPGTPIETYIFALFNENLKEGDETERHFGLFNPDKTPVYPVNFTLSTS